MTTEKSSNESTNSTLLLLEGCRLLERLRKRRDQSAESITHRTAALGCPAEQSSATKPPRTRHLRTGRLALLLPQHVVSQESVELRSTGQPRAAVPTRNECLRIEVRDTHPHVFLFIFS